MLGHDKDTKQKHSFEIRGSSKKTLYIYILKNVCSWCFLPVVCSSRLNIVHAHGVFFPATSKVLALVIGAVPIALPLVMQAGMTLGMTLVTSDKLMYCIYIYVVVVVQTRFWQGII